MAASDKWKPIWEANKLVQCKLPDLKEYLKGVGLPMAGDASAVAKRVKMHLDVKYLDLFVLQDGKKCTPHELKPPQIRKVVAQLGMDPTGDKDELHELLIEYLKKKSSATGSVAPGTSSAATDEDAKGITLAKLILEMADDYPAILSSSGINVITDSPVGVMRKAYLKLSLLIHPDKLQGTFPDATKAFQCLVRAYERLSQPELFMDEEEEERREKKKKTLRSNDGCHRTQIFCPRCRAEWGLPDSGTETYDYNFMMMGLRTFNCAGCLFEFGCMSASHKCPFCRKNFDYHPNDYNRKVSCGNAKCSKLFGFYLFPVSERREAEYRAEIRAKQIKQLKEKEQLAERSKRAKSRQAFQPGKGAKNQLFILNLLDECPNCGEEVESSQELREEHLNGCNDKKKIAAYEKKLKEERDMAETKAKLKEAQEEVQNAQSWDYLGGKVTDLWLLTEKQLVALCKSYKLDSEGSKDELISRVANYKNSMDSKRMITGGEAGEEMRPTKRTKISVEDLPPNMESMSVGQLKAVCASFGIVTGAKTKAGIIGEIEKRCYGKEEFLRITDGSKK